MSNDHEADAVRRGLLAALPAALAAADVAQAQNAARVQPGAYRVVLENEHVRVLEYVSRPGMGVCGVGVHSHPAHLTIPLTPGRVRVRAGGRTMIVPNPAGEAFWEEAVTHEVENVSGNNMRALLVEVKGASCRR